MLPCVLPSVRNRRVAALEVSICRLRHGVSDTVAPQFEPADFKEIAAELEAAVWPILFGGLRPAAVDNAVPSDRLSVRVAQIWYELLGIRPRMGDDFFLCRGHSLLATRLVFEIQQRTRVKIARRDIFRTPTLRGQGALVADQVPRGFDVVAQKLT